MLCEGRLINRQSPFLSSFWAHNWKNPLRRRNTNCNPNPGTATMRSGDQPDKHFSDKQLKNEMVGELYSNFRIQMFCRRIWQGMNTSWPVTEISSSIQQQQQRHTCSCSRKRVVVVDAEGGYLVMIHWVMVSQVQKNLWESYSSCCRARGSRKKKTQWSLQQSRRGIESSRAASELQAGPQQPCMIQRKMTSLPHFTVPRNRNPTHPEEDRWRHCSLDTMDPGPIGIWGLRKLKTLIDCRVFGLIRPIPKR